MSDCMCNFRVVVSYTKGRYYDRIKRDFKLTCMFHNKSSNTVEVNGS